jgi:hypothetical protein
MLRMDVVGCGVRDEAHMGERREIGLLQGAVDCEHGSGHDFHRRLSGVLALIAATSLGCAACPSWKLFSFEQGHIQVELDDALLRPRSYALPGTYLV